MTLVNTVLNNEEKLKIDAVFLEKPNKEIEKEILSLVQNIKNKCPFSIVNYFSAPPFEYRAPPHW